MRTGADEAQQAETLTLEITMALFICRSCGRLFPDHFSICPCCGTVKGDGGV